MKKTLAANMAILCLFSLAAIADGGDITFNLSFLDVENNTNVGFDDPTPIGGSTLGEVRRNTFVAATEYLNSVLDEDGSIDIAIQESELDASGFVAEATFVVPVIGAPGGGTITGFVPSAVLFNATGVANVAGPDATITFDFGFDFNSTLDQPGPGKTIYLTRPFTN